MGDVVQSSDWTASMSIDSGPAGFPATPYGRRARGELDVCHAVDRLALRPATIRRQRRLHVLIDAFSARDMDAVEVAALLECSSTSARNYLSELLAAAVIMARRAVRSDDGSMRNCYCLNGDSALVCNFLADLDAAHLPKVRLKRGSKQATEARSFGTRHFHIIADDRFLGVSTSHVAVRRDPLVAALFGKERPPVPVPKEY
jgi:hypothetical protein